MPVILRLRNLPWSASASHIRRFFQGLSIPEGGVHIVGGENGDAFIAFETDEDARLAMLRDNQLINNVAVRLFLSSKTEMMNLILKSREDPSFIENSKTQSVSDPKPDPLTKPVLEQPVSSVITPHYKPQLPFLHSTSLWEANSNVWSNQSTGTDEFFSAESVRNAVPINDPMISVYPSQSTVSPPNNYPTQTMPKSNIIKTYTVYDPLDSGSDSIQTNKKHVYDASPYLKHDAVLNTEKPISYTNIGEPSHIEQSCFKSQCSTLSGYEEYKRNSLHTHSNRVSSYRPSNEVTSPNKYSIKEREAVNFQNYMTNGMVKNFIYPHTNEVPPDHSSHETILTNKFASSRGREYMDFSNQQSARKDFAYSRSNENLSSRFSHDTIAASKFSGSQRRDSGNFQNRLSEGKAKDSLRSLSKDNPFDSTSPRKISENKLTSGREILSFSYQQSDRSAKTSTSSRSNDILSSQTSHETTNNKSINIDGRGSENLPNRLFDRKESDALRYRSTEGSSNRTSHETRKSRFSSSKERENGHSQNHQSEERSKGSIESCSSENQPDGTLSTTGSTSKPSRGNLNFQNQLSERKAFDFPNRHGSFDNATQQDIQSNSLSSKVINKSDGNHSRRGALLPSPTLTSSKPICDDNHIKSLNKEEPPNKRAKMSDQCSTNHSTAIEGYFILVTCQCPDLMRAVPLLRSLKGLSVVSKVGIRVEEDELGRSSGYAGVQLTDKRSFEFALDFKQKAYYLDRWRLDIHRSDINEFYGITGCNSLTNVPSQLKLAPTPSRKDCCLQIINIPLSVTHDQVADFFSLTSINPIFIGKMRNIYSTTIRVLLVLDNQEEVADVMQKNDQYFPGFKEKSVKIIVISKLRCIALKEQCEIVKPIKKSETLHDISNQPCRSSAKPDVNKIEQVASTEKSDPISSNECHKSELSILKSNEEKQESLDEVIKVIDVAYSDTHVSTNKISLPSVNPDDLTIIQVNNAPKLATVKEILSLFRIDKFVSEENVIRDPGSTKMFIPFENASTCQMASLVKMRMCRGCSVRLLQISRKQMEGYLKSRTTPTKHQSVTVNNLPMNANVQSVETFFKDFKLVPDSIQFKRSSMGKPLGEATVVFHNASEADKAIKSHSEKLFSGRRITMKLEDNAQEDSTSTKIQ